ncbi:MAG: FkbM family methyltransferase [Bacteroidota bacterium]
MFLIKKLIYKLGSEILGSELYNRLDFTHHLLNKSAYKQQLEIIKDTPVRTIFDVGARFGSVSRIYRQLFPGSKVYAFEPFPESYEKLQENTKQDSCIIPYNLAISDKTGQGKLFVNKFSATNSILPSVDTGTIVDKLIATKEQIMINTTTIDEFLMMEGLNGIDILKLDIQGGELKALQGAKNLLSQNKISLIYTEVEFMNIYEDQPLFHDVSLYLHSFGYQLYNIYNPWFAKQRLLWADALFLSPALLNLNYS